MPLDDELFQLATLGGLVLMLLILLLIMSILGRIQKKLKEPRAITVETHPVTEPAPLPAAIEPAPAATFTPATYEPAPVAAAAPMAAQPVGAVPGPYAAPAPQAAAPPAAQEPQDQPFERDGRWWFRRGNELLIYDEQSAQWVPAPAEPAGAMGAAPVPGGEAVGDSGFWKCPSCGAVNGSTATSCRMCFTARP